MPTATTLQLTDEDRRLLDLIADGLTHAAIARRMAMTVGSVTMALHRLYNRMEVRSGSQAATIAIAQGLIPPRRIRYHANSVLPCETESARRRHLARNEWCARCGVEGVRDPLSASMHWLDPIQARSAA